MEGIQSISARDKILREIVSNLLAHRDFSSGYPAKFIIERAEIRTENANLAHGKGELQLDKFEPFPKNPPISKVFREIGYADELGSGMRNTNKYTKMYSGGTPSFNEGDIFVTTIPLTNVADVKTGPKGNVAQDVVQGKDIKNQIYRLISENSKITRKEIAKMLGVSEKTIERHIKAMDNIVFAGRGYSGHWIVKK